MAEIPTVSFVCTEKENGRRLGDILREKGFSRKLLTRLKRTESGILRNSQSIRTVDTVFCGDEIIISESETGGAEPNPKLNVMVLFEEIKHRGDTLSNFFAAHCPNTVFRCVNRLDRDTSGCVVVAKSRFCANALQKSCEKVYLGICRGLEISGGRICAPIAREKESIIKRCVREDGQFAATTFTVVKRYEDLSLCRFILETGRTHQIRCHMAHIGAPLVGDDMYGEKSGLINRQALHCGEVSFTHPVTGERLTVKAPMPSDMKRLLYL